MSRSNGFHQQYERVGCIGSGTNSVVILYRHKKTKTSVAVKEIFTEYDSEEWKVIKKEKLHFGYLNSPNIVKLIDHFECRRENLYRLILEYCPGGSLDKIIGECNDVKLSVIALHILRGLDHMHLHGFIHRDIKPANLLCHYESPSSKEAKYKLGDLGSSKNIEDSVAKTYAGTVRFMAPEIRKKLMSGDKCSYDSKVDIWSFGATLLYLGEGHGTQISSNPKFVRIKCDILRSIICRCLIDDPQSRSSAKELLIFSECMLKQKMKSSEDLIREVFESTLFELREVQFLLSEFRKIAKDSKATYLSHIQFEGFIPTLLSSMICDFSSFETNKNYTKWLKHFIKLFSTSSDMITFQSFANTLSRACRGENEEKSELLFDIFDFDGDGVLNENEMHLLLTYLNESSKYNVGNVKESMKKFNFSQIFESFMIPSRSDEKKFIEREMRWANMSLEKCSCDDLIFIIERYIFDDVMKLFSKKLSKQNAKDIILCMRNNDISGWNIEKMPRNEFIAKVVDAYNGDENMYEIMYEIYDKIIEFDFRRLRLTLGASWYVVSKEWWDQWCLYTGFDATKTGSEFEEVKYNGNEMIASPRPKQIDNQHLLHQDYYSDILKKELQENDQFVLLPKSAWEQLHEWYGGGPSFERFVVCTDEKIRMKVIKFEEEYADLSMMTLPETLRIDLHPIYCSFSVIDEKNRIADEWSEFSISGYATVAELYINICVRCGYLMDGREIYNYKLYLRELIKRRSLKRRQSTSFWSPEQKKSSKFDFPLPPRLWTIDDDGETVLDLLYPTPHNQYAHCAKLGTNLRIAVEFARQKKVSGGCAYRWISTAEYSTEKMLNKFVENESVAVKVEPITRRRSRQSVRGAPSTAGCVGLFDLNHTSFMNCIIQCLSNTQLLRSFVISSAHQFENELSNAFANLIRDIWSGRYKIISPKPFNKSLIKLNPKYDQQKFHDAAEFLTCLLNEFGKNENSEGISELFQARQKSHVICPECNRNSITSDTYMYLSAPIVDLCAKSLIVDVFHRQIPNDVNKPVRHVFHVSKYQKVRDLAKMVANAYDTKDQFVLFYKTNYHYTHVNDEYDRDSMLGMISNGEILACYIVNNFANAPKDASIKIAKVCHSDASPHHSLFGMPFVLSFLSSHSRREVHKLVYKRLYDCIGNKFMIRPPNSVEEWSEILGNEGNMPYKLRLLPYRNIPRKAMREMLSLTFEEIAARYSYYSPIDDVLFDKSVKSKDIDIIIEWKPESHEKIKGVVNKVVVDAEYSKWKKEKAAKQSKGNTEGLTLYDCINSYVAVKPDLEYCGGCNKYQKLNKKLDFCSFAEILIIHLKRPPMKKFIDFPVYGLDLNRYVGGNDGDEKGIYDLYAVTYFSDHYFACALNEKTNHWFLFDNSSVQRIGKISDIVLNTAHILFYKRRNSVLKH